MERQQVIQSESERNSREQNDFWRKGRNQRDILDKVREKKSKRPEACESGHPSWSSDVIPDLPHGLGLTLPLSGRQGLHQRGLDQKSSKSPPVPRHESESAMMERQAEATCAGPCTRRTRHLSPASHL